MTGYRHRYAEPLTEWAELHGEPAERHTGPLTETCATHGDYTPAPGLDQSCPRCMDAHDDARRAHDARWDLLRDRGDRMDADHDHRTSQ